ncbi:hypothetical protein F4861DRAFT_531547 [Xylaria intraflava]|nr:hypothetical protein F4861DRAFT_531547 [Xylaria intraflava]
MPPAADGPTVALSFLVAAVVANNFWGKDDAGVGPLLDRMASSKQTSDELRSFYSARASIEDDYARKLASLSRKALGSHEMGSLKSSLDTVRGEVDSMAKQHASIAAQMKSELEEPLAAFAGGMKERRKIIQNTVEKILKVKIQQTHTVNKTRDRYEQDCLRIKGYLAQGHMVMGQEERKNKAKLEKTQISLASTNAEYEAAVKALEDTTARWNREWKAAADKFQDLEEERLDFTKSSLWTFANLASTVCVSDDASCEKIRLSLEKMDVENDITHFIREKGTGQEIPDPPKYINFCRGDADDPKLEVSEDDNYSVAQFPRSINPVFRTSSPQPSTYESHHDPNCALARDLGHQGPAAPSPLNPEANMAPQNIQHSSAMTLQHGRLQAMPPQVMPQVMPQMMPHQDRHAPNSIQPYDSSQFSAVPHDPYPMDGMTMLCRTDGMNTVANVKAPSRFEVNNMKPPAPTTDIAPRVAASNSAPTSDVPARYERRDSTAHANVPARYDIMKFPGASSNIPSPRIEGFKSSTGSNTSSRQEVTSPADSSNVSAPDDHSDEYSDPTSFSSQEPPSGKISPVKTTSISTPPIKAMTISTPPADSPVAAEADNRVWKKKSGFFQNHSPFRRKSIKDVSKEIQAPNRHTWAPVTSSSSSTPIRSQAFQIQPRNMIMDKPASPEPIDANASLALNVGENVFPVAKADKNGQSTDQEGNKQEEPDPIALALAELKGAADHKQSVTRVSADRYHGISTPIPEPTPDRPQEQAIERPQTRDRARPFSRAARADSDAGAGMRGTPPPSYDMPVQRLGVPPPAVTSKAMQEASRKYTGQTRQVLSTGRPASVYNSVPARSATRQADVPRAASPAPPRSISPQPNSQPETRQAQRSASPNPQHGGSPQPSMTSRRDSEQGYFPNSPNDAQSRTASPSPYRADYDRPVSRGGAMAVQLASFGGEGSTYGSVRSRGSSARPGTSGSSRTMSFYDGRDSGAQDSRQRSRSIADPSRQYTPEGRAILHYARALYMYQAVIPEELGFAKGDILAVLRHQDDGWWEAEIHSGNGVGQGGLVPSNYLQSC